MPVSLNWQKGAPPPAARGPKNSYAEVINALKSKPGTWAIVSTCEVPTKRKGGQIPGYQTLKKAGCEVATRRDGTKVALWACWPTDKA